MALRHPEDTRHTDAGSLTGFETPLRSALPSHLTDGELVQIQFLLRHVPIQTTELYSEYQAEAPHFRERFGIVL